MVLSPFDELHEAQAFAGNASVLAKQRERERQARLDRARVRAAQLERELAELEEPSRLTPRPRQAAPQAAQVLSDTPARAAGLATAQSSLRAEHAVNRRGDSMRRAFSVVPGGARNLAMIEHLVDESERAAGLTPLPHRRVDPLFAQDEEEAAARIPSRPLPIGGRTPGEMQTLILERASEIERGPEALELFLEERSLERRNAPLRRKLSAAPGGRALLEVLEAEDEVEAAARPIPSLRPRTTPSRFPIAEDEVEAAARPLPRIRPAQPRRTPSPFATADDEVEAAARPVPSTRSPRSRNTPSRFSTAADEVEAAARPLPSTRSPRSRNAMSHFADASDETDAAARVLGRRNDARRRAFGVLEDGDSKLAAVELLASSGAGSPDPRFISPEEEERLFEAELAVQDAASPHGAPSVFHEVQAMLDADAAEQEALIWDIAAKIPGATESVLDFRAEQTVKEQRRKEDERWAQRLRDRVTKEDAHRAFVDDLLSPEEVEPPPPPPEPTLLDRAVNVFERAEFNEDDLELLNSLTDKEQQLAYLIFENEYRGNRGAANALRDGAGSSFGIPKPTGWRTAPGVELRSLPNKKLEVKEFDGKSLKWTPPPPGGFNRLDLTIAIETTDLGGRDGVIDRTFDAGEDVLRFVNPVGVGVLERAAGFLGIPGSPVYRTFAHQMNVTLLVNDEGQVWVLTTPDIVDKQAGWEPGDQTEEVHASGLRQQTEYSSHGVSPFGGSEASLFLDVSVDESGNLTIAKDIDFRPRGLWGLVSLDFDDRDGGLSIGELQVTPSQWTPVPYDPIFPGPELLDHRGPDGLVVGGDINV